MIIGIDASRAFVRQRTGTENYSWHLLYWLAKIDGRLAHQSGSNQYLLYLQVGQEVDFDLPPNFKVKKISLPRLWTQAGLAARTFLDPLDVLFIPAHTLPVIRKPGLKTVVTIHGLEYEYLPQHYQWPQKLFLNRSTEYAVRHADRLIAVSGWTKNQLVDRLGAKADKIEVIYEGVDQDKFKIKNEKSKIREIKKKYNIKTDYVLFVGTIQPRKNLIRLIKAFGRLLKQHSKPLSLVLVGKPGWKYDQIHSVPAKLKIQGWVKFLGHVPQPDLVALYQGAKVFCLPSLMEGFGLPVLEAMSAGIPVVASRAGALAEIVGQAGLLVNPVKTREITTALRLVNENQPLRESLKEAGLKRVQNFTWLKTAQKTLKTFEDLE